MKKVFTVIAAAILFFIIIFFAFRNVLLTAYLDKKIKEFNTTRNAELSIGHADLHGWNGLELNNIILKEQGKNVFFKIDTLLAELNLFSIIKGDIGFNDLYLANSEINILEKGAYNNYSFLFKRKQIPGKENLSYKNKSERFIELIFNRTPENFIIRNMGVNLEQDSINVSCFIKEGKKTDDDLYLDFSTREANDKASWKVKGMMNNSEHTLGLKILPQTGNAQKLPYIKAKYGMSVAFDSIIYNLQESSIIDKIFLNQNYSGYRMNIHHWRISSENVKLPFISLNSTIGIGDKEILIDSTTVLKIDRLPITLKGSYNSRNKEAELLANFNEIDADTFFTSLPEGLFSSLQGIKAKGKLTYNLYFKLPYDAPDSVKFKSLLTKNNFKIIKPGSTNLTLMNNDFTYTAYEKEVRVKTFIVGKENPMFFSLPEISNYLKEAVLTSEDGAFFSHKGFNEEAFRQSIATNVKEKRFVRGGSTISMQLVKNVFLTRNKTISRKIEEALIVWLIENNRLVTKERMYEVYLNIIEWGPGIYGIGEASDYYFSKKPSELTLEESLFLAMIIPRPKFFKYNFEEGVLKPYVEEYFKLIAGHLVKKQVITEEQKQNLKYNVELKGRANLLLKKKEDIVPQEEDE